MINLLTAILTSYIVTCVVTKGHVFLPARKLFRRIMWRTPMRDMFVRSRFIEGDEEIVFHRITLIEDDPNEDDEKTDGFCFISCRLCCGFYITLATCLLLHIPLEQWLMVYGASYWLATQERQ
jgi:hypothetical protein